MSSVCAAQPSVQSDAGDYKRQASQPTRNAVDVGGGLVRKRALSLWEIVWFVCLFSNHDKSKPRGEVELRAWIHSAK